MNFIEIKDNFIDLNKVCYIDFGYDDEDFIIQFQFEIVDNYKSIYFDNEDDFIYWMDYLRKKINC